MSDKKGHNLDGFIDEAKENIANDRAIALKLLTDMMQGMQDKNEIYDLIQNNPED